MLLMLFREEICIGKQFSHHSSDRSLLEQFELSLVNVSFVNVAFFQLQQHKILIVNKKRRCSTSVCEHWTFKLFLVVTCTVSNRQVERKT